MGTKTLNQVPRQFDDQLEALVSYIKQQGWTITGVDMKTLEADLAAQRGDRQKDLDLQRQSQSFRRAFLEGQTARYGRYMKALQVVRAANRDNGDVKKALTQFKRPRRHPASTVGTDTTTTASSVAASTAAPSAMNGATAVKSA